jgi:hypothetical protein
MPLGGALTIAGAATGLIGGIGGMFASGKSNKELKGLMKNQPSAIGAQQRLGLAQQLFNARMPGAAAAERNIATSAAGTMANASRAASSGAQLLAMGGASQGQVGEAYNQLAQQEATNRQQQYQNLAEAQQATDEDRYRMFQNKVQLQGAIAANRANMWNSVGNLGGQIANLGTGLGGGTKGGGVENLPKMKRLDLPDNIQPLSSEYFKPSMTPLPSISPLGLSLPPGVVGTGKLK